jgi:hypothetical protein
MQRNPRSSRRRSIAGAFLGILTFLLTLPAVAADSLLVFPSLQPQAWNSYSLSQCLRSRDKKDLYSLYFPLGTDVDSKNRQVWKFIVRKWNLEDKKVEAERSIFSYGVAYYHRNIPRMCRVHNDIVVLYCDENIRVRALSLVSGVDKDLGIPLDRSTDIITYFNDDVAIVAAGKYAVDLISGKDVSQDLLSGRATRMHLRKGIYMIPLRSTDTSDIYDVFSLVTWQKIRSVETACRPLQSIAPGNLVHDIRDGFVIGRDSAAIDITNVLTGERIRQPLHHKVDNAEFTCDGKYMVFADDEKQLLKMNCATGAVDTIDRNFILKTAAGVTAGFYELSDFSSSVLVYATRDTIVYYSMSNNKPLFTTYQPFKEPYGYTGYRFSNSYFVFNEVDTLTGEYTGRRRVRDAEGRVWHWPYSFSHDVSEGYGSYADSVDVVVDCNGKLGVVSLSDLSKPVVLVPEDSVQRPGSVLWQEQDDSFVVNQHEVRPPYISYSQHQSRSILAKDGVIGNVVNDNLNPSDSSIVIVSDSAIFFGSVYDPRGLRSQPLNGTLNTQGPTYTAISSDNSTVAYVGTDNTMLWVRNRPDFANAVPCRLTHPIISLAINPTGTMIAVLVATSPHHTLFVYDESLTKVLFTAPFSYTQSLVRFSPSGRYLQFNEDILDVQTWKSVYFPGGDYNGRADDAGFVDNDTYFVRSTERFGLYLLNLRNKSDVRYKDFKGTAHFGKSGEYVFVVDSANTVRCIRTKDWTELSRFSLPLGVSVKEERSVFPHPTLPAVGILNGCGTLYIWYPLTSSVTSVDNTTFRDTSGGSSYAISIPCRNGISQLALQAAPDPGSMRVIDVLGREVAWSMENSTVRLSQCHAGYHLVTYRHAGRTQSIPVMVVEE